MLLQMRLRLSVMMFFEYFIWGVWYVTLGTWLGQQLHFSGKEIGLAAGTTALGAMLSPFLVGLMADEWFATQRLLAALHGIGGVLLWVASTQTTFGPMYFILLIYSLCYMPTMALTNSLSFRQMKDLKQDFGFAESSARKRAAVERAYATLRLKAAEGGAVFLSGAVAQGCARVARELRSPARRRHAEGRDTRTEDAVPQDDPRGMTI